MFANLAVKSATKAIDCPKDQHHRMFRLFCHILVDELPVIDVIGFFAIVVRPLDANAIKTRPTRQKRTKTSKKQNKSIVGKLSKINSVDREFVCPMMM